MTAVLLSYAMIQEILGIYYLFIFFKSKLLVISIVNLTGNKDVLPAEELFRRSIINIIMQALKKKRNQSVFLNKALHRPWTSAAFEKPAPPLDLTPLSASAQAFQL